MKLSINWLLVFIPITLVLEHTGGVSPPMIFFSAALAIIPIAALVAALTISTVHAQDTTPDTVKTRLGDLKFERGYPTAPRPIR